MPIISTKAWVMVEGKDAVSAVATPHHSTPSESTRRGPYFAASTPAGS